MHDETIGERVARLRGELGLSREALSHEMKVSHTAIYKVEVGITKWPKVSMLQKYADALVEAMPRGVDPVLYIIYGIEPVAPPVAPRTDWAIDNDEELDDDARAYLRHALEYVRRTQTRNDTQNAS